MSHRRRAKAPTKNASKVPKEVDLTITPTLPSTIIEQPKDP